MTSPVPLQFTIFAAVGAIGTAAHYLMLIALVEAFEVRPILASTAGFIAGAAINYLLNYRYTFRSSDSHLSTLPRFLLIAGAGAAINAGLLGLLADKVGVHYLIAQLIATAVVLVWSYFGSRLWAFSYRRKCLAANKEE